MSVKTFDASIWRRYAPASADYGDHTPTRSGAVLMDGACFLRVAVPDADRIQKDPAAVERVMHRLISSVKENTGAAVVRLVELEAYTTRHDVDALKARFAFPKTGEKEEHP